jgi:ABC-2 type transport system ATP-binding protein
MNIKIKGITAAYGRSRVLSGIDWNVRPGVTGLLGPNGSGKTTLLAVIAGLMRPSEGSVTIRGGSTGVQFGFLPQRFSIAGCMRLVDAISYTVWINGMTRRDSGTAARRALAAVDLTSQANAKVKTLSSGERQKAGIAAGLVHEPDVLILDEPTVGLDTEQRWRVRNLIAEIGRTRLVVVSTHLLDDVSYLCERVGVLASGRLMFDGTVAELEATGDDVPADARHSPIEAGYERLLAKNGDTR